MLKMEKRLLEWVEKHMLFLLVLLAAAITFYLKRPAVWWSSPDANAYFDGHANRISSVVSEGIVRLLQHLPLLPLHSVKWLSGLADYGIAFCCLIAVGEKRPLHVKSAFLLVACMFSPIAFLRGICWAQMDAPALLLLLLAYLLWEREHCSVAMALAVFSCAWYPPLLVVAVLFLLCENKRGEGTGRTVVCMICLVAGTLIVLGICGALLNNSWMDGIQSGIRWLSYDAVTGQLLMSPIEWLGQMVSLFGYSVSMLGLMAVYQRRMKIYTLAAIFFGVLLVYANILFPIAH